MRTEPIPPLERAEIRYMLAAGGCASELALQSYAVLASQARFKASMRRLWEFVSKLEEHRGRGLPS